MDSVYGNSFNDVPWKKLFSLISKKTKKQKKRSRDCTNLCRLLNQVQLERQKKMLALPFSEQTECNSGVIGEKRAKNRNSGASADEILCLLSCCRCTEIRFEHGGVGKSAGREERNL